MIINICIIKQENAEISCVECVIFHNLINKYSRDIKECRTLFTLFPPPHLSLRIICYFTHSHRIIILHKYQQSHAQHKYVHMWSVLFWFLMVGEGSVH